MAAARSPAASLRLGRAAQRLLVAPHVEREAPGGSFRVIALGPDPPPAALLVEPCHALVSDGATEPRDAEAGRGQSRLRIRDQRRGDAGAAGLRGDVDLVRLVFPGELEPDGIAARADGAYGRKSLPNAVSKALQRSEPAELRDPPVPSAGNGYGSSAAKLRRKRRRARAAWRGSRGRGRRPTGTQALPPPRYRVQTHGLELSDRTRTLEAPAGLMKRS